jgi:hypothetical protein
VAAVVPGGLDQQPAGVGGASLGDRALAALVAGGLLAGNEAQEASQQPRARKRGEVADLGDQADRGQGVNAA